MEKIQTGLDVLLNYPGEQSKLRGQIAYLGHQASVTNKLGNGLDAVISIFGKRLKKAFGPQHGYSTSVQDNMIETPHHTHPIHNIPVYSLYSETRVPTPEMLDDIDVVIVDLQDVGTRVYTYIWTLYHIMEAALKWGKKIVVLDRPNPIGGLISQGNFPEPSYYSFVCRSNIPMRHGMTIGEMAKWFQKFHFPEVDLHVIKMKGWNRSMHWQDTGLDWINPSPNLPTPEGCLVYPGTVLFEGTNLSEGRGTTRSLEIVGHPDIHPEKWKKDLDKYLENNSIKGQFLRPIFFEPVFQKFQGISCGGYQIHVTDKQIFNPWKLGQLLISFFYERLEKSNFWNTLPYEYEFDGLAMDWINGTNKIRELIEKGQLPDNLDTLEKERMEEFNELKKEVLLYI